MKYKLRILSNSGSLATLSEVTIKASNYEINGQGMVYRFYDKVHAGDGHTENVTVASYPTNNTIIESIK